MLADMRIWISSHCTIFQTRRDTAPEQPFTCFLLSWQVFAVSHNLARNMIGKSSPSPPPPLSMLQLSSTVESDVVSGRTVGFGLSALSVEERSVEQSFEITSTALKMKGYEIGVNGISLRPSSCERPHVNRNHLTGSTFVPFGFIGKGASGTVTKALNIRTYEVFALKSIGVHVQAQRHQLVKELNTYASVDCKYIVDCHGAFYEQGTTIIVLDYMNRGSLQQVLDAIGPLPESALQRIAKQTLFGLRHMHLRRKVHRDIKPGNILLNSAGEAKLADFGIVKELDAINNAQTFVGTQIYMSPERIQSQPYGCSADIWSFGLTLATCASGRFPYDDAHKGFIHVFQSITMDPPPVLPKSRSSVGLRNFVSKCLIKDPEQRWTAERLLTHPWLNDVDIESSDRQWPWDGTVFSENDTADLQQIAAIIKERRLPVPQKGDYMRLANSLSLPQQAVESNIQAVL